MYDSEKLETDIYGETMGQGTRGVNTSDIWTGDTTIYINIISGHGRNSVKCCKSGQSEEH